MKLIFLGMFVTKVTNKILAIREYFAFNEERNPFQLLGRTEK